MKAYFKLVAVLYNAKYMYYFDYLKKYKCKHSRLKLHNIQIDAHNFVLYITLTIF